MKEPGQNMVKYTIKGKGKSEMYRVDLNIPNSCTYSPKT